MTRCHRYLLLQDIADCSYRHTQGRPPTSKFALSEMIADTVFSVLLQTLFLIQVCYIFCYNVMIWLLVNPSNFLLWVYFYLGNVAELATYSNDQRFVEYSAYVFALLILCI